MPTIAVIGAGELGGATAHALAVSQTCQRIVLIDSSAAIAAGKALDIQQSGAIAPFQTRLEGSDDLSRAAGCAALIIADRAGPPSAEWHGDEGALLLRQLAPLAADAPLIFAGAAQTSLLLAAARDLHIPRARLIGSAPEAYASAVRSIVAMEARGSPGEVMLTVLGAPPAGFVVPWSEASIGGYSLEHTLSQVQLGRIEARAARLWPPGPYTLGLAAAHVTQAALQSSRRAFSVLTVLDGEFGVRNRVGAVPALLSASGVVHTRQPSLSARERVQLDTALGV
jgi:malate/lactate dehydrogenase